MRQRAVQVTRRTRSAVESGGHTVRSGLRALADRRSGELSVVCFHRVAHATVDPWSLAISPDDFREAVEWLKSMGPIVDLDREVSRGRVRSAFDTTTRFALTFDDGYADNWLNLVPVLEELDAPCTVFVASDFIDDDRFWWDRLPAIAWSSGWDGDASGQDRERALADHDLLAPGDAASRHTALYERLVWRDPDSIRGALAALEAAVGAVPLDPACRPLTSDELTRLDAHPLVTIGNHTARHRRLSTLSRQQIRREIDDGAAGLDRRLRPLPRLLAYPYGDVSARVISVARRAGVRHAFTTETSSIVGADGRLRLPRHDLASVRSRLGDRLPGR